MSVDGNPRVSTEERFASHDGVELFYRHWLHRAAVAPAPRRAIVLLHRGHEHGGRMQDIVDQLDLTGIDCFAWDARGHGHSPGERGYAADFGVLVRDVDTFVRTISTRYQVAMSDIVVIGSSVGAVLAATWVHDYAPRIRALVLGSPAFRVKLYIPFAVPLLRVLLKLKGKAFVTSYVKAKLLTHDPAKIASYESDPLITRQIAVNILLGLHDAGTKLMDDAGAITVPTQVLVSAADWVVQPAAQRRFYDALGSKVKSWHSYPGFFHDTFNERDNHLPIGEARSFILARFAQPLDETSLLDADRAGHTKAEYDALLRPLPALSPKALNFAATRLSMRTLGRASEGIRLGLATGFDSGATLDYVYRNEARGVSPIGRAIDRTYLDAIGWRGIRIRRQHVVEMLGAAIERVRAASVPVHIVDIATGHGRYVLDALKAAGGEATALLRDYSAANVEAGRTLAHAEGRTGVQFAEGDAFDEAGLAALSPRPTIAVVSGLYELFPDNAPVRRSLAGLAASVPVGGYLVYTNQPWHPQVEMIARTLTSHRDGAPWIMRRRTQAEMDELVRASGFEKIDQRTDEWGIFTVSMARRIQ